MWGWVAFTSLALGQNLLPNLGVSGKLFIPVQSPHAGNPSTFWGSFPLPQGRRCLHVSVLLQTETIMLLPTLQGRVQERIKGSLLNWK